jgi:hypothetical protein
MMAEKFFGDFCTFGSTDLPTGMLCCVLTTLGEILSKSSSDLIHFTFVLTPMLQLLQQVPAKLAALKAERGAYTGPPSMGPAATEAAYVGLLKLLCLKLQEDNKRINYFVTQQMDLATGEMVSSFMIFSALLPYMNLINPNGDTAREGIKACLMTNVSIDFVVETTDFAPLLAQGLVQLYHELPKASASSASRGGGGGGEDSTDDGAGAGDGPTLNLLPRLKFLHDVIFLSPIRISDAVVREVVEQLFRRVIVPDIQQANEAAARMATLHTRTIVKHIDDPNLLDALAELFFGGKGPSGIGEVGAILVDRMEGVDEELAVASMQLIDAFLERQHWLVMEVLVFRGVTPGFHIDRSSVGGNGTGGDGADGAVAVGTPVAAGAGAGAGAGAPRSTPAVASTPRALVTPMVLSTPLGVKGGTSKKTPGGSRVAPQLLTPARQAGATHIPVVDQFLALSPTGHCRDIMEPVLARGQVVLSTAFDSYLHDADRAADMSTWAVNAWSDSHTLIPGVVMGSDDLESTTAALTALATPGGPVLHVPVEDGEYRETPFLYALFNRLECMLTQPLAVNLMATGLAARFTYSPLPAVDSFFLDAALPVKDSVRTLPRVLEKLAAEAQERGSQIPGYEKLLETTRLALVAPTRGAADEKIVMGEDDGDSDVRDRKRFLQAVVVLEEFCKELAAVVQTKKSRAPMEMDFQMAYEGSFHDDFSSPSSPLRAAAASSASDL